MSGAAVGDVLEHKSLALTQRLAGLQRVVVAYSGGVDSTFLAATAHDALSQDSLAVTAVSPSLAAHELESATDMAHRRGWNHLVIETHEVDRHEYARNSPDRCYWCKTELFEVLTPIARRRGAVIAVGTNLDDLGDHRPGQRAAREHEVVAPLAEVGLSKEDVRSLSRDLGLPTHDKPATPCLASRFAYGVKVTAERLRRVEAAEQVVRSLGFEVFRVRDHGDLARVEVPAEAIVRAARSRERIASELTSLGWRYVTLDLAGFRSGSMNEVLGAPRIGSPHTPSA